MRHAQTVHPIPKPRASEKPAPAHLFSIIGEPTSAERRALRDICDLAEAVQAGDRQFLVIPLTRNILETLATFEAELKELEEGGDLEPDDPAEDDDVDEDD